MTAGGITIKIGGAEHEIAPLTLGQLREILPAFAKGAQFETADGVDNAVSIVFAALRRNHQDLTRDQMLAWEVTPTELAAAVDAVAKISGLVPREGTKVGEQKAS